MTLLVQQKQKEDKLGEDYFLSFLFYFLQILSTTVPTGNGVLLRRLLTPAASLLVVTHKVKERRKEEMPFIVTVNHIFP